MNKNKRTLPLRLRNLGIILSLCLILLPQWVKAENALLQTTGPTALVQVKLGDESKLAALDAFIRQSALLAIRLYAPLS